MPAFRLGKTVIQGLFGKPATELYPVETKVYVAGMRGRILIEEQKCTLCLLCDKRCPTQAIKVDRVAKTWAIDRLRCISCNYCVEVCPKKCLILENRYSPAVTTREIDTVAVPYTPPPPKKPAAAEGGA